MADFVHRNGAEYRLWGSIVDAYLTPPLSRDAMRRFLTGTRNPTGRATAQEAEERLAHADEHGTSQHGHTRPASEWKQERCVVERARGVLFGRGAVGVFAAGGGGGEPEGAAPDARDLRPPLRAAGVDAQDASLPSLLASSHRSRFPR